jgi:hypothetical protein
MSKEFKDDENSPKEKGQFSIFNSRTDEVVGKASTLHGARRSRDRHDNKHGSYAHSIKDSTGKRYKSGGKIDLDDCIVNTAEHKNSKHKHKF